MQKKKISNTKKLETSASEFRRSMNRQEQQANLVGEENVRRMLLFYAVECGGKYQLLKKDNCFLFNRMPEKHKNMLHDIQSIMKELGLEEKCDFPVVRSKHGDDIYPNHYQEMWRYGIDCEDAKEQGRYIEENLRKALGLLHDLERRR